MGSGPATGLELLIDAELLVSSSLVKLKSSGPVIGSWSDSPEGDLVVAEGVESDSTAASRLSPVVDVSTHEFATVSTITDTTTGSFAGKS